MGASTAPHQAEGMTTTSISPPDTELRQAAITRLRKKRGMQAHLIAYVTVNALLIGIWWATGAGFFWPIIPLLGWGIGVIFNVWDVYSPEQPSEERIQKEMQRMRRS